VNNDLLWLAIVGAVTSVISAYYYLNVIRLIWFADPAPAFERDTGPALGFTAFASAALMFPLLTIFIGPIRVAAENAAKVLF